MFKIEKFFDNLKYEKVLPLGSRDVLSGNAARNNYLALHSCQIVAAFVALCQALRNICKFKDISSDNK